MKSHFCQGRSSTPRISLEKSITSYPNVLSESSRSRRGGVQILGSAEPRSLGCVSLRTAVVILRQDSGPDIVSDDQDRTQSRIGRVPQNVPLQVSIPPLTEE